MFAVLWEKHLQKSDLTWRATAADMNYGQCQVNTDGCAKSGPKEHMCLHQIIIIIMFFIINTLPDTFYYINAE